MTQLAVKKIINANMGFQFPTLSLGLSMDDTLGGQPSFHLRDGWRRK